MNNEVYFRKSIFPISEDKLKMVKCGPLSTYNL